MSKIALLGMVSVSAAGCGLFDMTQTPQAPFTISAIIPTVSFPTSLDCSSGGANPINVSWDVKPMGLSNITMGMATEFSAQESLANTAGNPSVCYYTPAAPPSVSFGTGLRPGRWQISLTHYVPGYPNPIICTQQLAAGNNSILFTVDLQNPGCQASQ